MDVYPIIRLITCVTLQCKEIESHSIVGVIVCKLDIHGNIQESATRRGYIGMLAVRADYRGKKIGTELAHRAIATMKEEECDEVCRL